MVLEGKSRRDFVLGIADRVPSIVRGKGITPNREPGWASAEPFGPWGETYPTGETKVVGETPGLPEDPAKRQSDLVNTYVHEAAHQRLVDRQNKEGQLTTDDKRALVGEMLSPLIPAWAKLSSEYARLIPPTRKQPAGTGFNRGAIPQKTANEPRMRERQRTLRDVAMEKVDIARTEDRERLKGFNEIWDSLLSEKDVPPNVKLELAAIDAQLASVYGMDQEAIREGWIEQKRRESNGPWTADDERQLQLLMRNEMLPDKAHERQAFLIGKATENPELMTYIRSHPKLMEWYKGFLASSGNKLTPGAKLPERPNAKAYIKKSGFPTK